MQKVTVTRVSTKEVDTQYGKSTKIGIQTAEQGETWFGAFTNKYNEEKLKALKEGDVIEIVTYKKGDFWNFKLATEIDKVKARLEVIEKHLDITEGTPVTVDEDETF